MVVWWETENSLFCHHFTTTTVTSHTECLTHPCDLFHIVSAFGGEPQWKGWQRRARTLPASGRIRQCLLPVLRPGVASQRLLCLNRGGGRTAFRRGALPRWLTQKFNEVSCLLQMSWRCVLIDVCSVGSCWRHRPHIAVYVSGPLGKLALVLPPVWTRAVNRWPSFSVSFSQHLPSDSARQLKPVQWGRIVF